MTQRTSLYKLQVATNLYEFIDQQVLPGTGVSSVKFWKGFDALVQDLAPKNKAL
jgi:malate synthase